MAWYHTFFSGLPQRAWKLNQSEEQTDYETDFLMDVLALKEGDRVLDMLSGYGRHAVGLARQGVLPTCVDISEEYCEELRDVAGQEGLPVEVVCGDVLTFSAEDKAYQAAYCMGNSFSFFSYDQMMQFLRGISDALVPGSYFVVHSELISECVLPDFQMRSWMPVGEESEILFLMNGEYDALEGCIRAELTYVEGAERFSHFISQYVYSLAELRRMFAQAGLPITETFSDLEGEPFRLGDEQIYILARKE